LLICTHSRIYGRVSVHSLGIHISVQGNTVCELDVSHESPVEKQKMLSIKIFLNIIQQYIFIEYKKPSELTIKGKAIREGP
jgi:hypothetical protein